MNEIKVAKLSETAVLPTRKHPDDAGIDFYANEYRRINPHTACAVGTGITMEIPRGYVGLLMPKSSTDFVLGAGVVDAGYQGEIRIKIVNTSFDVLTIQPGQAIGQMLILPVETPAVREVPADLIHQEATARGATGGILGTN